MVHADSKIVEQAAEQIYVHEGIMGENQIYRRGIVAGLHIVFNDDDYDDLYDRVMGELFILEEGA